MAMSAEQILKLLALHRLLLTYLNEWKIIEWDEKLQTTNQPIIRHPLSCSEYFLEVNIKQKKPTKKTPMQETKAGVLILNN